MTYSGSWKCDATVDTLKCVCAVLLPASTSASHSVHLQENESVIESIIVHEPPSSSSNRPLESRKSQKNRTPSVTKCSPENAAVKRERDRALDAIVLTQARNNEKFTFGASQGNDVVLKHPTSEAQYCCYINLLHCELYPDPDSDALMLYNNSTSIFSSQSSLSTRVDHVTPGQRAALGNGDWWLTLGKGLKFQISVIPRVDREVYHGCISGLSSRRSTTKGPVIESSRIVRPKVRLPPPSSSMKGSSVVESCLYQAPKAGPPTVTAFPPPKPCTAAATTAAPSQVPTAPPNSTMKSASDNVKPPRTRRPKATITSHLAKASSAASPKAAFDPIVTTSSILSKLSASVRQTPPPSPTVEAMSTFVTCLTWNSSLISKTKHANVFKATRDGMTIAVKVCRGDDIKQAANTWRNEVDILKCLRHPCIVELIHYEASTLHLELEYIGPSLAHYINKEKMSSLSENAQSCVWIDVSNGLEHIHARGIIHNDIKPGNILFDRYRGAVICDFGVSARKEWARMASNAGTACYIPPEYLYDNQRGTEGDVWAFGVTMLFVFRLIALPSRDWIIADIASTNAAGTKMKSWLASLRSVTVEIPEARSLLRRMLIEKPWERITATSLVKELAVQSHGTVNRIIPA